MAYQFTTKDELHIQEEEIKRKYNENQENRRIFTQKLIANIQNTEMKEELYDEDITLNQEYYEILLEGIIIHQSLKTIYDNEKNEELSSKYNKYVQRAKNELNRLIQKQ